MPNIIEKHNAYFVYSSVVMNLILSYQFYSLWANPGIHESDKILSFATIIFFEIFMVHSGVLMVVLPRKLSLYLLFPTYGLIAFVINASVNNNTILAIYCLVVFNRMRFAFSDVSDTIKAKVIMMSILSAILYFLLIFVIVLSPIPELGLTKDFLNSNGYFKDLKASGIFVDQPQYAMCMGFVYYILLAVLEVLLIKKHIIKE